jgi:multiple sugar transport system substrate-binding protein
VKWLNHDGGLVPFLESGGFPATVAELNDPAFVDKEDPYFGDQPVNQVLTAAAGTVVEGWQYLPYQLYANTIYGDTVGKSYQSHSDLNEGLQAWQDALVEYGNEQGFQVGE